MKILLRGHRPPAGQPLNKIFISLLVAIDVAAADNYTALASQAVLA
ncbi:hypothetical protein [Streptomyces olivaceus]